LIKTVPPVNTLDEDRSPCQLLQGLLDNVLSEYLWATAVLLTSPSVATVGLALTVTLATSIAVDDL
jgi:hypothetical protein